jgi:cell fate (sporulation/competence/biofilm development) regulator YlbF (YheA/YmcA/DUF963 family)
MLTLANPDSIVARKTAELCQSILDEPEFQAVRRKVDDFMADDSARSLYQAVVEKGEHLQHKQSMGAPLSDEEVAEFEGQRGALMANPVAQGFIEAQETMHGLQQSVGKHLAKTFELGRVPTSDDMGGCGSGCGCH